MNCCVIPGCENKFQLYRVPNSGNNRFRQWKKVAPVFGTGSERICSHHFIETDFVENIRKKLKSTAIPSINLPAEKLKASNKIGCCVLGCRSKDVKNMEKFPSMTSKAWLKWANTLGCVEANTAGWKICLRHFKEDAFTTVTSRYLKNSAVPTRNLKRPVKIVAIHRRRIKQIPTEQCLLDHDYAKEDLRPKSNRMCSVYGCTTKTSTGVFLHKFPKERTKMNAWVHAIKSGKKPTKNSFVCSQHFHDSDYNTGSNILRKSAVPSQNIPLTFSQEVQIRTDDPYKRIVKSFRKPKDSLNSQEALEVSGHSSLEITMQSTEVSHSDPSGFCAVDAACNVVTPSKSEVDLQNNNENENVIVQEQNNDAVDKNVLEKTIQVHGKAILSDFLITEKDLNTWTGIPSMKLLEVVCAMVRTMEDNVYPKKYKMHTTDRVILTLVKMKQNISFAAVSTIFSISPTTAAEYFSHTIQVLSEVLGTMIYWPPVREIKRNIPHCFKGKFENVRCILDCTEISIASPNCLNCRIACYSNYKHKRTVKFLLGVTPAGLISYCSRAYSGKSSDKYIFNKEKFIDKLVKHQDEIMVDKGFAIDKECTENGIRLHIPPFLRDTKLKAEDALLNESIAKARVHVERAISRVKLFGVLQGCIDASVLRHVDDIMIIACAIVNLSAPILKDDKF